MEYTYDKISVGKRIKKQRRLLGITQKEFAKSLHLNSNYYSDIECGLCGMSIQTLIFISQKLKLSLDYIIFGINDNQVKISI